MDFSKQIGGSLLGNHNFNSIGSSLNNAVGLKAPTTPTAPAAPSQASVNPTPTAPSTPTTPPTALTNPGPITGTVHSGGSKTVTPGTPFLPTYFNGELFNDPHALSQAVITDANAKYNQALKNAQTAYSQGLISFKQQQQAIDNSRQALGQQLSNDLSNISGYFSSVNPYGSESAQATQESKAHQNADLATATINNNQANLGTAEQNAATTEQQNEYSLAKQLQNNVDAAQNTATLQEKAAQPTTSTSSGSTNTYTYDPIQLGQSLAQDYYNTAAQVGSQAAQQQVNTNLSSLGLNPSQVSNLGSYLYGGNGQQGLFNDQQFIARGGYTNPPPTTGPY